MQGYYAARAPEYDRVYLKPERQADLRKLEAWLPTRFAGRKVLEVAAGTGYWTQFVAPHAASMVITDGTSETLEIARQRVTGEQHVFAVADAYALPASLGQFDAALVGFWLSHVPRTRLKDFFTSLHARLLPGAQVVMLDNLYVEGSNHAISEPDTDGNTWQTRKLDDGSSHRVLKNFPDEQQLHAMIEGFGAQAQYRQYEFFWTFEYRAAA